MVDEEGGLEVGTSAKQRRKFAAGRTGGAQAIFSEAGTYSCSCHGVSGLRMLTTKPPSSLLVGARVGELVNRQ